jgi:hypothetical protein
MAAPLVIRLVGTSANLDSEFIDGHLARSVGISVLGLHVEGFSAEIGQGSSKRGSIFAMPET